MIQLEHKRALHYTWQNHLSLTSSLHWIYLCPSSIHSLSAVPSQACNKNYGRRSVNTTWTESNLGTWYHNHITIELSPMLSLTLTQPLSSSSSLFVGKLCPKNCWTRRKQNNWIKITISQQITWVFIRRLLSDKASKHSEVDAAG